MTQTTQRGVVDWQSYSIGQGGRVTYQQPSASAATLNRVTGTTTSTIAGEIRANGQVYLVNPNGVVISPTGSVKASAFVASTLGISDADFNAGRNSFTGNGASKSVVNQGKITTSGRGGFVALIGGTVVNEGTIRAPGGKVGLGAGERVSLDLQGDGFLSVSVPSGDVDKVEALIRNSGKIRASGGRVEVRAATTADVARAAINVSGSISASSARSVKGGLVFGAGSVVLSGGRGGSVSVSGKVTASSRNGDGGAIRIRGREVALSGSITATGSAKGGKVTVTGKSIGLTAATVDVSGKAGGGSIRIGGDYQGAGKLPHADTVVIDGTSTLKADATDAGQGGRVIVWSDAATRFDGQISAQGGPNGGDGGFAEVSSHGLLTYSGFANLTAAKGAIGDLLLDPYNVTISSAASSNYNEAGFTPTGNSSVLNAGTLTNALSGANVTISTRTAAGSQNGDITVAAPLTWMAATTLTLQTPNSSGTIAINAAITATSGGLSLESPYFNPASATAAINVGTFSLLGSTAFVQNANGGALAALTVNDFRVGNGSITRVAAGDGSAANPFQLVDAYGLQGVGRSTFSSKYYYTLATDIDARGTQNWNAGAGFQPLGTSGINISLDGQNRSIYGLTIYRPTTDNIGLFANFGTPATIQNLAITDANIAGRNYVGVLAGTLSSSGLTFSNVSVGGIVTATGLYAGGFAGQASGMLSNVSSSVNVVSTATDPGFGVSVGGLVGSNSQNLTLSNVSASGSVTAIGDNVGGLIGAINNLGATITNASASGAVSGRNSVGGLLGNYSGFNTTVLISNSSASGAVSGVGFVGGLVGRLSASNFNAAIQTVTASSATGTVTATGSNVGGLIGSSAGFAIQDSYAAGSVTGVSGVGGLLGSFTTGTLTRAYALGAVTGTGAGNQQNIGGLIGSTYGATVDQVYSTGLVSNPNGGFPVGGLVGQNYDFSPTSFTNSYWDTQTSGRNSGFGYGGGGVAGLTTAQARGGLSNYSGFDVNWYQNGDMRPILKAEAAAAVGGVVAIGNAHQLALVGADLSGSYRLTKSIDLTATNGANAADIWSTAGFVPIGTDGNGTALNSGIGFSGIFNGQGFSLSHLYIDRSTKRSIGLFGQISNQSVVTGVNLSNGNIIGLSEVGGLTGINLGSVTSSTFSGQISSSQNAGGLVGLNRGTISGSSTSGTVRAEGQNNFWVGGLVGTNNGSINKSYSSSDVISGIGGLNIGGLVGVNTGAIRESWASGAVSTLGAGGSIGGLVGNQFSSSATIVNSYATGSVNGSFNVGGLLGFLQNGSNITGSYATGLVTGPDGSSGGLVGSYTGGTISASYFDTSTTGQSRAVGNFSSFAGATGLSTSQARIAASYSGWDFTNTWFQTGDLRPILRSEAAAAVNGVVAVSNLHQLVLMGANLAGSYKLIGNIDATETSGANASGIFSTSGFVPIGYGASRFSGELDGQGQTISQLTINRSLALSVGLIGTLDTLGAVKNLNLNSGSIKGDGVVGGIVGINYGSVSQSQFSGSVSGQGGGSRIGGLVGTNWGKISQSATSGSVSASPLENSVGGFVGQNSGSISDSYSSSVINANVPDSILVGGFVGYNNGTIINSLSTGQILSNSSNFVGGFVGYNANLVTSSFWDNQTSGIANASGFGTAIGALGYNTATLQNLNSFRTNYAGWDFQNVWVPPNQAGQNGNVGNYYPQLYALAKAVSVTTPSQSITYGDTSTSIVRYYGVQKSDTKTALSTASVAGGALPDAGSSAYALSQTTAARSSAGEAYRVVYLPSTLTVAQKALTVSLQNEVAKTYDGTNTAMLAASNYNLTGFVAGQGGSVTRTAGTYSSVNVGTGLGVSTTVGSGDFAANIGTKLSNYILPTGMLSAGIGTINAATLSYAADAASRQYGDANPALTGSVTGFVNNETLAGATTGALGFSSAATTANGVGSYSITGAGLTANNGNYVFVQAAANATALTIAPRQITVTADAKTKTYGAVDPALTYQVGGKGLVNSDALTGSLTRAAGETVVAGGYQIQQGGVSNAANPNYVIAYTGAALTVTPATLTVTPDAGQFKVYGAADPTLTYVASGRIVNGALGIDDSGLAFTGSLARTTGETVAGGPYAYAAGSLAAGANYTIAMTANPATFAITPATLTVTPNAGQSKVYGAADPVFAYATSGQVVNAGLGINDAAVVPTGALGRAAGEAVLGGPYAYTLGTLAANTNYQLAIAANPATFAVTPATVTAALTGTTTKVYDKTTAAVLAPENYQLTGFVAGQGASVTQVVGSYADVNAGAGKTVSAVLNNGSFAANGGTDLSNYALPAGATGAIGKITPAPLTIVGLTAVGKVYDATTLAPLLGAAQLSGTVYAGDTIALAGVASGAFVDKNAGAAKAVALSGLALTSPGFIEGFNPTNNYALTLPTLTATITPATLTYVATPGSRTYGDANPALTGTVTGFVAAETLATATSGTAAYASPATAVSAVGSYAVSGSGLTALNGNYAFAQAAGNATALTVTQRAVTATADAKAKTVGEADPALTFQLSAGSLVNGDAFSGALSRQAGEAAGALQILQGTLALSANYALSYRGATLTISPAPVVQVPVTSASAVASTSSANTPSVTTPAITTPLSVPAAEQTFSPIPPLQVTRFIAGANSGGASAIAGLDTPASATQATNPVNLFLTAPGATQALSTDQPAQSATGTPPATQDCTLGGGGTRVERPDGTSVCAAQ